MLQLNVKLSKGDTLKRKPSGSVWDQLNEQAPAAPMTLLNRMFTPLAESKWMEIVILICIILNTGILAIQVRRCATAARDSLPERRACHR